jgi:hypothetical protein
MSSMKAGAGNEFQRDFLRVWAIPVLAVLMILPSDVIIAASSQDGTGRTASYIQWWDYAWKDRRPITINNTNNTDMLYGFQLMLNVTYDSEMIPDFSDLRFIYYNSSSSQYIELPYYIDAKADGMYARVWFKMETIPGAGTTTVYMYYGNAAATSKSNPESVFEFFDDFNGTDVDTNKWTVVSSAGFSVAGGELKGTSTTGCLHSKIYLFSGSVVEARVRGVTYAGNSHNPISAYTSSSDLVGFYWGYQSGGWTFYSFYLDGFPSANYNWRNNDTKAIFQITMNKDGNLDLVKRDYNSFALLDSWSQFHAMLKKQINGDEFIRIGRRADDSYQGQTYEAYWDWVRLRKFTANEPKCAIGDRELPIIFKSLTFSPLSMSEGDQVSLKATFTNPSPDTIKLSVTAKEGDSYYSPETPFFSEDVNMAPSADTIVPFTWTAMGGMHIIWVAAFGYPQGSVKINVNRNPILATIKDQSLWQDKEFLLQINATDPDGDALSWSMDNPMFNLAETSNHSAEISLLPTNDDVGIHRANISVTDRLNRSSSQQVNLTVHNVNDPPVLSNIPSLSATEYQELRYQAKATDPDTKWGDILTFTDNTGLFDIDGNSGVFSFTPTEEQVGKHIVKITVTDLQGASETSSFSISVANVNDPPTLEFLPPQFALQGRLFQLKVSAADPDLKSDPTEKLRFSDDCPLFSINIDTGLISFTPTNDELGTYISNITVTDKGGLSNTTELVITVMNANDPPSLDAIPVQTATEDQPFGYQVVASDPDLKWGLDNLTFSDDTDIFNIDPKTGEINFTPTAAQVGVKRITITVKDEKGGSASASFDLTVVHINHPPYDAVIKYPRDGARLKEGDDMWLEGAAKDSDKGDKLEFGWIDNGEPVGTGKNISVKLRPGKHLITLDVSDGIDTARAEVDIEVAQKEHITVANDNSGIMVGAVVALVAVIAIVAIVAIMRKGKKGGPVKKAARR